MSLGLRWSILLRLLRLPRLRPLRTLWLCFTSWHSLANLSFYLRALRPVRLVRTLCWSSLFTANFAIQLIRRSLLALSTGALNAFGLVRTFPLRSLLTTNLTI